MRRSNAAAAALIAVVVIVGVLALRYRPVLPSAQRPAAATLRQAAAEPAYPPASIDGRPEPVRGGLTVELCGYGSFEIAPGRMHPPHLAAAADLALAQATAAMADASEPRQRAAARYLQATDASQRTHDGYVAQHPDCDDSPECRAQASSAAWRSFASAREALVADALTARDASAYALAFYACLKRPRDVEIAGACRLVSAAQWAQLDSNNLMAWVHAAWEAQAAGDAAGRAEALRRAAQATESRLHVDAVMEPLGHPSIRNLDSATRSIAQTNVLGVRAAMALPGLLVLNDDCLSKQPLDDARRDMCSAVGRTLADRSHTMLEMAFGVRIGERAGWPDEELRALRERRDAYHGALTERVAPWTCRYQQQLDQYTTAALEGSGELQVAEKLVKASGRSPAELAQQWRARSASPSK